MKKKISLSNTYVLLSIAFALLFLPVESASAASLLFSSSVSDGHVGLHQMFKVKVKLDPEGQTINSLEARIFYPHDLLKLSGIEDGSSFLSMWLDRPHEEGGTINLSGIAPRGFDGNINNLEYSNRGPGDVVTLIFDPIKAGTAVIGASSSVALLNDGLGTQAALDHKPVTISIGDYLNTFVITGTDSIAPDFIYAEAHYDATLGGQYIFFQASDKDSGIDHYEIKNGNDWQTIQSPYLIKQNGGVYYIKAVDRAGNEKIKEVQATSSSNVFLNNIFWLIVALLVILTALIIKYILIKKRQKSSLL